MHSCATLINYYFETLFSKTFSISCLHILRTVRNTSGPSILLQRRPSHSEEESTHNEPRNAYLNIFASRNNDCIFRKLPPSFSTHGQAGTTCGASSQPDLIQNHFLIGYDIARMLRFLRHSRQKVPYFNI